MPFIIIGAVVIGLMLGLMGSGGSILTVPVLVYVLGHDGKAAIAESLAIVGGIAFATMFPYARSRLVSWRNVVFFGIPGMAGTYFGAWLSNFVGSALQLTLFAVVMLLAAGLMFKKTAKAGNTACGDEQASDPRTSKAANSNQKSAWLIGLEGLSVGVVTGLVGVGGGFLIVPALVVFGKLPMRMAIGTSLAVIALKSLSGFYKYLDVLDSLGASIDWPTVGAFVAIGILGSLIGHASATRLNQAMLRRAFALSLIGMGLFVLGKETPKLFAPPSRAGVAVRDIDRKNDPLRTPVEARPVGPRGE